MLEDIRLTLSKGEHLFVLGESGCGKSTLLHLIYGLLELRQGDIHWKNKQLFGPSRNLVPGHDCMKLVAQEFDLMPFTTVAENVGTHLARIDLKQDESRVRTLLEIVNLEEFSEVEVKNLSGGQKQRVALAKALANEPEILLLDEPFSHIDTFRKNKLRRSLFNYLKKQNITCIVATHDSDEALSFADTILILNKGKNEALGSPQEIYNNISTSYQASFFDEVSILSEVPSGKERILLPHQLMASEEETKLQVTVKKSYFRGSHFMVHATYEHRNIYFNSKSEAHCGQKIYLTWNLNA